MMVAADSLVTVESLFSVAVRTRSELVGKVGRGAPNGVEEGVKLPCLTILTALTLFYIFTSARGLIHAAVNVCNFCEGGSLGIVLKLFGLGYGQYS